MAVKLIALGNVLMMDDGIAVSLTKDLEPELMELEIEVVYGETDIQYSISSVKEEDYIIILDASCIGKAPGEITKLPLYENNSFHTTCFQHSFRFVDLLRVYYPKLNGFILAVEAAEIKPCYGLSKILFKKKNEIEAELIETIKKEIGCRLG